MVDLLDPDATAVVRAVLAEPPRLGDVRLLAVDGPSGSGKSTLAQAVRAELERAGRTVGLVSTDDFATWDDPVSWWPRLAEGVLHELAEGRPGRYRRTRWPDGVPVLAEWVAVDVPDVLVLEGMSAGRASVRAHLSCLCRLTLPGPAERLERAVRRDGESARRHFEEWQAFEKGWFEVDDGWPPLFLRME
ncbi:Uridine kinase [Amycolatopsis marina]|uniref:Uridine kinase n=1 Tax=Amycolatopsis marina TaxID=490629 RepID=A0A1I0V5M7_9PSEU|nr:uridine kinase [Amycolatopsis marina]SFA71601.1 Uridine kinase [Amycolatopsis marina]